MLRLIAAIVVFYPLVELAALLYLGRATSVSLVLLIVVLTGLLGIAVMRWQSYSMVTKARQQMAKGEVPSVKLLDGFMLFVAAVLLILPGVIGDLIGFSMLFPPVRRFYLAAITWYLKTRFRMAGTSTIVTTDSTGHRTVVVDSQVVEGSAQAIDEKQRHLPDSVP